MATISHDEFEFYRLCYFIDGINYDDIDNSINNLYIINCRMLLRLLA